MAYELSRNFYYLFHISLANFLTSKLYWNLTQTISTSPNGMILFCCVAFLLLLWSAQADAILLKFPKGPIEKAHVLLFEGEWGGTQERSYSSLSLTIHAWFYFHFKNRVSPISRVVVTIQLERDFDEVEKRATVGK